MVKKTLFLAILAITLVSFYSCKSSDSDNNGNGGGGGGAVSFSQQIQPIFTANCATAGCHDTGTARAGLILVDGQSYTNLVNVNSTREPNFVRVLPSDADNSYLVIKLEGRQTVGAQMPLNGSITANQLQLIRNWIDEGADNN